MGDVVFSASIIAAFFAGMVALFAPCCITVLLPAYLASAFRNKQNILKMTFLFFAGISVILVPIGMGAAGLAELFRNFHQEMYVVGGAFMLALAILAIMGKGISVLPKTMAPRVDAGDSKSVFLLGMFSGAATSCCAPVLAGAVALAVISGVFWKALIVTFAYVFGMTFPLFIAAYFYDRFHIEKSKIIRGKIFTVYAGKKAFSVHSTNLVAGIVFLAMGITLLLLAFSGNAFWAPSLQGELSAKLNQWSQSILNLLGNISDGIWGVIILGIFFFLVYRAVSRKRNFQG